MSDWRALGGLLADRRGAVFVEFLLVIVPLWTAFLCLVQLAFFGYADLIVKRAADAAARSASVVLPDDPEHYGGEPQMSVARESVIARELDDDLRSVAAWVEGESESDHRRDVPMFNVGRSRLNTIRLAANVPLIPLAPRSIFASSSTVRGSLASERSIAASLLHNSYAVAVTFPHEKEGRIAGSTVEVRVTYAYACMVPLARAIFCSRFSDLPSPEFESSPAPALFTLALGRFKQIQHETTALIQAAPYDYRPRSDS